MMAFWKRTQLEKCLKLKTRNKKITNEVKEKRGEKFHLHTHTHICLHYDCVHRILKVISDFAIHSVLFSKLNVLTMVESGRFFFYVWIRPSGRVKISRVLLPFFSAMQNKMNGKDGTQHKTTEYRIHAMCLEYEPRSRKESNCCLWKRHFIHAFLFTVPIVSHADALEHLALTLSASKASSFSFASDVLKATHRHTHTSACSRPPCLHQIYKDISRWILMNLRKMIASNMQSFCFMVRSICLAHWFFKHTSSRAHQAFPMCERGRKHFNREFSSIIFHLWRFNDGFPHRNNRRQDWLQSKSLFHIVALNSAQFFPVVTLAHVFELADKLCYDSIESWCSDLLFTLF